MEIIVQNRKALWNYNALKSYTAGVVLKGSEVKSIRKRDVNLNDAFAKIFRGEIFLVNMHIAPYKGGTTVFGHEPTAMRKLLLTKREIAYLSGKLREKGYALVPTKLFWSERNLVKVEIILGTGKRSFDKRQALKEKENKRSAEQALKHSRI